MDTQALALTIAGAALPFVQEIIVKNHIEGRMALWLNFAVCAAIAAVATAMSGGFAGGFDPATFVPKVAEVFALSQFVFKTIPQAVAKVGGTAEPSTP